MGGILLRNLRFAYEGDDVETLRGVQADLGTTPSICGGNGSGKTTLGRCIAGIIPTLIPGNYSGSVFWEGRLTHTLTLHQAVAFLPQRTPLYFSVSTAYEELAEVGATESNLNLFLTLAPFIDGNRYLDELSGGELQRLALASVLARGKPLNVLDEPFNFLDADAREIALGMMSQLAEHGRAVVRLESDCRSIPQGEAWRLKDGILSKAKNRHPPPPCLMLPTPGTELFSGRSIGVQFGRRHVLRNLAIDLRSGEALGIVGRNGAGKTTLLRALAGLERRASGKFVLADRTVSSRKLRRNFSYVPQDPSRFLFASSVRDELEAAKGWYPALPSFRSILNSYELEVPFDLEASPFLLSSGQQRLLAIFVALTLDRPVLLLDEPFAALDPQNRLLVARTIGRLLDQGRALVIVSHDVLELRGTTHRICRLEAGVLHQ